jgi:hypothetical protein
MKRKPSERKGCDLCKVDYPTMRLLKGFYELGSCHEILRGGVRE